jgi:hypothetical protein
MGKNQGVTNLPPLKKSRPRDLVAQGLLTDIPTWGNRFQLGFPFYLCVRFPLVTQTDYLALMWFVYWILILTGLFSYIILILILLCRLTCPGVMYHAGWIPCPSHQSESCFSWTVCDGVQYGRPSTEWWTNPLSGHEMFYSLHRVVSNSCVSSRFKQCQESYIFLLAWFTESSLVPPLFWVWHVHQRFNCHLSWPASRCTILLWCYP